MKKLIIGLALVALLLVPVSCGVAPEAEAPEEGGMAPDEDYTPESLPSDEERMIVRTGEMSMVVEDVTQACDDIARLAVGYDGYTVSSQIWGEDEDIRGQISIRVPAEKFELALTELRNLAVRVESESTRSEDITEEYVDLQSRLNNAEATEQQYLALLEKTEDVDDILKIYERLSWVRQEIEQIKGRMQYLERTTSMSLIEVSLEPEVIAKPLVRIGWNALEVLKSAARGLVVALQVLGTLAIWLLIFIPIWGTILGIILWRRRKKKKA
ncbi:MAG: DUF4349 domain-containing protein [Dehalococcoidales bacterium]|nr:DUF4349 domain-containing protein [Dehalococcoidales bacterium]